MHWYKRALIYLSVTVGSMVLSNHLDANAGVYDAIATPAIVSTSVQDAQKLANNPDNLYTKMASVIKMNNDGQHIGNAGLLVGSTDATDNISIASSIRTPLSLNNTEIKNIDTKVGHATMEGYRGFGLALNDIVSRGTSRDPSSMGIESAMNSFGKATSHFGRMVMTVITRYNPSKVLLAFYNKDLLNDQSNEFMKWLNQPEVEPLKNIISWLATEEWEIANAGVPRIVGYTFIFIMFFMVLSMLGRMISGIKTSEQMRKVIARMVLLSIAVPGVAYGIDTAISILNTGVEQSVKSEATQVLEDHLNLQDWYATGFALPSGTYKIQDGQFVLDGPTIRKINEHSAKLLGYKVETEEDKKLLAARMIFMTTIAGNKTQAVFNPSYVQANQENNGTPSSNPVDAIISWIFSLGANAAQEGTRVDDLKKVANDMADNGKNTVHTASTGYLKPGSIKVTEIDVAKNNYTLVATNDGPGLNPIAAYNAIRTDFTPNNITSKTNLETIHYPSVIIHAKALGKSSTIPGIISFYAQIVMMITGIKVLLMSWYTAFGSIGRGAVGAATGDAPSTGKLIGGAVILTFGLFGIPIIMGLTDGLMTLTWSIFTELLSFDNGVTDSIFKPIRDALHKIPLFGGMIAGLVQGITTLLINIVFLLIIPKMVTVPINAYGEYIQGIPERWADKGQQWLNKFTGDFRAGGHRHRDSGRSMNQALQQAGHIKNKAKNMGIAGASAIGGATIALAGKALTDRLNKDKMDPNKPADVDKQKQSIADSSKPTKDATTTQNQDGGKTVTGQNENGQTVSQTYDKDGNLTQASVSDETGTKTQTFDEDGNVVQEQTQLDDGTTNTWKQEADGSITDTTSFADGSKETTMSNPDGSVSTVRESSLGERSIASQDADGNRSSTTEEPDGTMKTVHDNGDVTRSRPNAQGGFDSVTEHANGDITKAVSDKDGNIKGETAYADGTKEGFSTSVPTETKANAKSGARNRKAMQATNHATAAQGSRQHKNSKLGVAKQNAKKTAQVATDVAKATAQAVGAATGARVAGGGMRSGMASVQNLQQQQEREAKAFPSSGYQRFFEDGKPKATAGNKAQTAREDIRQATTTQTVTPTQSFEEMAKSATNYKTQQRREDIEDYVVKQNEKPEQPDKRDRDRQDNPEPPYEQNQTDYDAYMDDFHQFFDEEENPPA